MLGRSKKSVMNILCSQLPHVCYCASSGESAGSASVHLQTLSPMSRGLFAGAISIGGTALSPWAHVHEPGIQAIEFGEELGCPKGEGEEGSRQMIACLKALPMHRVASYHIGYIVSTYSIICWVCKKNLIYFVIR